MMKPTILMAMLLAATPLATAAQQQPTTPPASADTLPPRMMHRGQVQRGQMQRGQMQRGQVQRSRMQRKPQFMGGAALLGPRMKQELGLTDEQVKRLDVIREEVRAEQQKRMEAERKAHEAVRARMLDVLTPEQQKKLNELRQQGARAPKRNM